MWVLLSLDELIHHWSGQSHTWAGSFHPPAWNTALGKFVSFSLMLMCCCFFLPYSGLHTASSCCLTVSCTCPETLLSDQPPVLSLLTHSGALLPPHPSNLEWVGG